MPNRNHRGASSTNRPHSQHTYTPTHHSTPHINVQHHHEQSTRARHSHAHHTSPVIREMHRPPRDYRTHPMEIPHPDAKRSSPVARHFTPPKFDDLWKAAHEVYPVGQHRDDDYVLDLDADVIGGKVAFNLRKNPKTGDRVYENACAIRMSYILQQNGYRIPRGVYGKTSSGADKLWYLVLVTDMIKYIESIWKNIPSVRLHNLRDDREIRGKAGLLIFSVPFGNASGHVTLWNKTKCYDHCYFQKELDKRDDGLKVTEIRFWELH